MDQTESWNLIFWIAIGFYLIGAVAWYFLAVGETPLPSLFTPTQLHNLNNQLNNDNDNDNNLPLEDEVEDVINYDNEDNNNDFPAYEMQSMPAIKSIN